MKMRRNGILVVEDDANERILIESCFKEIGIPDSINLVRDGAEAISYLKSEGPFSNRDQFHFPSLVLTDLKMPRVNGFELLLYVKRSRFIIIPTVVLTSSSDPDDVKNAFLLGANAYHVKPTILDEMCRLLKLIYEYWSKCEMPESDAAGNLIATDSGGKLSQNTSHPVRLEPPPFAG